MQPAQPPTAPALGFFFFPPLFFSFRLISPKTTKQKRIHSGFVPSGKDVLVRLPRVTSLQSALFFFFFLPISFFARHHPLLSSSTPLRSFSLRHCRSARRCVKLSSLSLPLLSFTSRSISVIISPPCPLVARRHPSICLYVKYLHRL